MGLLYGICLTGRLLTVPANAVFPVKSTSGWVREERKKQKALSFSPSSDGKIILIRRKVHFELAFVSRRS